MQVRLKKKDFRFHVSRLCFAFTATLGDRGKTPYERLNSPKDLSNWLIHLGFSDIAVKFGEGDLEVTKRARETIQRVGEALAAGLPFDEMDLEEINAMAIVVPPTPQLVIDQQGVTWKVTKIRSVLSMIARDFIDLATGPLSASVKVCANPECLGLFVDESRPKNRRWCSMQTCGNQMKKLRMKKNKI